jgi:hypothetical protein
VSSDCRFTYPASCDQYTLIEQATKHAPIPTPHVFVILEKQKVVSPNPSSFLKALFKQTACGLCFSCSSSRWFKTEPLSYWLLVRLMHSQCFGCARDFAMPIKCFLRQASCLVHGGLKRFNSSRASARVEGPYSTALDGMLRVITGFKLNQLAIRQLRLG